jgi:predicted proteasome-type protease
LCVRRYRRLDAADPDLVEIRSAWEHALRKAIGTLPKVAFAPQPQSQDGVAFTRGG